MFEIHLGIPEMEALWNSLLEKVHNGSAKKNEIKLYKQLGKAMALLSSNPKHPGLNSHEITSLSSRYGMKVFESYLENNAPKAGRIIGLEPHPDDKSNAYRKVTLSAMGEEVN